MMGEQIATISCYEDEITPLHRLPRFMGHILNAQLGHRAESTSKGTNRLAMLEAG